MALFDMTLVSTVWVIKNNKGEYWSSRDQKWMGLTRATLYGDERDAKITVNSPKFMLKVDMETEPHVQKLEVTEM